MTKNNQAKAKILTQKNHYVTAAYLKGFVSKGKRNLFCFDKSTQKIEAKPSDQWGWESNLYSQEMEDYLAKYDSDIISVVKNIKKLLLKQDIATFNPETCLKLAKFFSFQVLRTPKIKSLISEHISAQRNTNPLYRDPIKEVFDDSVYSLQRRFEQNIRNLSAEITDALRGYTWRFIYYNNQSHFVTNDIAFAAGTTNMEKNKNGLGVMSPDTYLIFPLTQQICCVFDTIRKPLQTNITKEILIVRNPPKYVIDELNTLIFKHANRFVFSGDSENLNFLKEQH